MALHYLLFPTVNDLSQDGLCGLNVRVSCPDAVHHGQTQATVSEEERVKGTVKKRHKRCLEETI
jgi:hypothetical protein